MTDLDVSRGALEREPAVTAGTETVKGSLLHVSCRITWPDGDSHTAEYLHRWDMPAQDALRNRLSRLRAVHADVTRDGNVLTVRHDYGDRVQVETLTFGDDTDLESA